MRGRQRTDSTHVLAAVRDLNRVELLAEAHSTACRSHASSSAFGLARRHPARRGMPGMVQPLSVASSATAIASISIMASFEYSELTSTIVSAG